MCSQQVSTLHKQNFDLKLELYHRRQRQEALEARLEALEKDVAAQTEVNEELLAELEKRDQAVEEAVSIICDLEEEVKQLKRERDIVRSFEPNTGLFNYKSAEDLQPDELPVPDKSKTEATSRPSLEAKTIVRMPSFLSDHSEGTEALRSLYLPPSSYRSYSDATLPKLPEDGTATADGNNSPRLSVLSESSFLSVYGDKHTPTAANGGAEAEDGSSPLQPAEQKSSSVEEWIQAGAPPATTPTPLRSLQVRPSLAKGQYNSILSVVESTSPLQRFDRLRRKLEKTQDLTAAAIQTQLKGTANPTGEKARPVRLATGDIHRQYSTDNKQSFGVHRGLPPTPDTAHSSILRTRESFDDSYTQDSMDRMAQSQILEHPGSKDRHAALQSVLVARPRSAGETVTSRREGHGWDTETQEDYTETASISSNASNEPNILPHGYQTRRAMTPDLFMMNGDWGRDVMFNRDPITPGLPRHPRPLRYAALQGAGSAEPQSDDTILASSVPNIRSPLYNFDDAGYPPNAFHNSPRLELPDRRSSLSATTKLRKSSISGGPNTPVVSAQPTFTSSPISPRDSRTLTLKDRILGRNSEPPNAGPQQQLQAANVYAGSRTAQLRGDRQESNFRRSQSFVGSDSSSARATPPPIKRSRTSGGPAGARPSSAGVGSGANDKEKGLRSFVAAFGGDGASDAKVGGRRRTGSVDAAAAMVATAGAGPEEEGTGGNGSIKSSGPKRWFGRMGSIRK